MSSNPKAFHRNNRRLSISAMAVMAVIGAGLAGEAPVTAQDDTGVTRAANGAGEAVSGEAATGEEQAEGEQVQTGPVTVPQRPDPVDILITVPRGDVNAAQAQACEDRADAATLSGEIIVCRQLGEKGENYYSGSREEARKRYAEETAFQGENKSLDVSGSGIFKGPATVSGQCFIPPCPPEAAILIDVEALPQAPEGSDADRIARGLPPLGQDKELSPEEIRKRREALGLPPPKYEKQP